MLATQLFITPANQNLEQQTLIFLNDRFQLMTHNSIRLQRKVRRKKKQF